MSGDPREYYKSSRDGLPPIRDVVGDALDIPSRFSYRFDLEDVNRALPGSSKHSRYPSPGQHYYPERGPTLPPIRHIPTRSQSRSERSPAQPSGHTPHTDRSHDSAEAPSVYTYSASTNPQPATGPAAYSFNVLRAQQGDLVDVRTPSARAQGILRPTAIIEDEDDSHKRYKCDWPQCEKKYDRPSSLEVHRHTHTGSQPYPCQYPGCNRAFNVKSNMLRHFRSHPQGLRISGKKPKAVSPDNPPSEGEDEDEEVWPETSPASRYFHKASASAFRPHSTKGSSESKMASSPPQQYYSSSRQR